jgi:hypothetical protein
MERENRENPRKEAVALKDGARVGDSASVLQALAVMEERLVVAEQYDVQSS